MQLFSAKLPNNHRVLLDFPEKVLCFSSDSVGFPATLLVGFSSDSVGFSSDSVTFSSDSVSLFPETLLVYFPATVLVNFPATVLMFPETVLVFQR